MHYMQIQISRVEDQKISKFLVAAGPLGDAITGVQPGGGGEAEEDDGGKPSHPQVIENDDEGHNEYHYHQ